MRCNKNEISDAAACGTLTRTGWGRPPRRTAAAVSCADRGRRGFADREPGRQHGIGAVDRDVDVVVETDLAQQCLDAHRAHS